MAGQKIGLSLSCLYVNIPYGFFRRISLFGIQRNKVKFLLFLRFWISLALIQFFYFYVSDGLLNQIQSDLRYVIIAVILNLIFTTKYWFLVLTRSIQDKKPENWVNANLLAFTVKFILIIILVTSIVAFYKQGAKHMIVWTLILYCMMLATDVFFDLKFKIKKS